MALQNLPRIKRTLPRGGVYHGGLLARGSADPPDGVPSIVSYQQGTVTVDRDANRTPVCSARFRVGQETGEKILDRRSRPTIAEGHEYHFVSHKLCPVPRTVLSDKHTAAVTLRKSLGFIEDDAQRSGVRSERKIRDDRFGDKIGLLRLDARIQVRAEVAVRPTIEAALTDRGNVVGNKIIAEVVTLIHDRP